MDVIEHSQTWQEMTRGRSEQEIQDQRNRNLAATTELIQERRFVYTETALNWSVPTMLHITQDWISHDLFLYNALSTVAGRQDAIRFWTVITEQEPRPEELLRLNYVCRLRAEQIYLESGNVITPSPSNAAGKIERFNTLRDEFNAELQALRVAGRAEWQQILDAASTVPGNDALPAAPPVASSDTLPPAPVASFETLPDALRALIGSWHSFGVTINEGDQAAPGMDASSSASAAAPNRVVSPTRQRAIAEALNLIHRSPAWQSWLRDDSLPLHAHVPEMMAQNRDLVAALVNRHTFFSVAVEMDWSYQTMYLLFFRRGADWEWTWWDYILYDGTPESFQSDRHTAIQFWTIITGINPDIEELEMVNYFFALLQESDSIRLKRDGNLNETHYRKSGDSDWAAQLSRDREIFTRLKAEYETEKQRRSDEAETARRVAAAHDVRFRVRETQMAEAASVRREAAFAQAAGAPLAQRIQAAIELIENSPMWHKYEIAERGLGVEDKKLNNREAIAMLFTEAGLGDVRIRLDWSDRALMAFLFYSPDESEGSFVWRFGVAIGEPTDYRYDWEEHEILFRFWGLATGAPGTPERRARMHFLRRLRELRIFINADGTLNKAHAEYQSLDEDDIAALESDLAELTADYEIVRQPEPDYMFHRSVSRMHHALDVIEFSSTWKNMTRNRRVSHYDINEFRDAHRRLVGDLVVNKMLMGQAIPMDWSMMALNRITSVQEGKFEWMEYAVREQPRQVEFIQFWTAITGRQPRRTDRIRVQFFFELRKDSIEVDDNGDYKQGDPDNPIRVPLQYTINRNKLNAQLKSQEAVERFQIQQR